MTTHAQALCCHFWECDPPTLGVSSATCKRCGATDTFQNYTPPSKQDLMGELWQPLKKPDLARVVARHYGYLGFEGPAT